MSSAFATPVKGRKSQTGTPPQSQAKAVDLVTGKTTVEYFFDPSQVLDENTNTSTTPFKTPSKRNLSLSDGSDPNLYSSKHLFVPCTIVKSLVQENNSGGKQKRNKKKKGNKWNKNQTENIPVGGPALVKTKDGTLYKVRDSGLLTPLSAPDDYVGLDDVLHLANVNEASLLHTLRIRYRRDEIYTSAGPILISVNPYRQILQNRGESLYSTDVMMQYRQGGSGPGAAKTGGGGLPPHLFQVADRAYTAMLDSVHSSPHLEEDDGELNIEADIGVTPGQPRNQSIIISGESGAGKTEATKYIMQYLARITKKNKKKLSVSADGGLLSPDGKAIAALEDRVLSSNPLLESFGNAQTLRNDNSSRFGKFIHINFSTETGSIVGARISNYLLEKTRITTQIEGERNYHIFYQLLAGASQEVLNSLGLEGGASAFKYLGNRATPKTKKDASDFEETQTCLARIGLSTEEQNIVFALAAAVLHLGNVMFEEGPSEDHAAVITDSSLPSLTKACSLLGLNEAEVKEAILTKLLSIGGKTIKKPSTVAMAEDKRDALAKMTYSSLFLWLVKSINKTLCPRLEDDDSDTEMKLGFIGVLDIYGFECFETNGYEQLLINYCNEKLQRHFNKHLFEVEQNLYTMEGVDWTYITFNDNRPCLELIEGGSGKGGILNTLDDAYAGMGSAKEKDVKFVSQLHKLFGSIAGAKNTGGGHEYFVTPKFGNDRQFIIVHYAGEVSYTADDFVEKNMESLSNELKDLGDSSTVPLAHAAFSCSAGGEDLSASTSSCRRSSIRGFSVASQFKLSLQSLVEDLECTQPHYIRCVKPNLKKSPNSFVAGEVLKQLRYSGMMEAIRIRREGYALREPHQSFYNRFCVLLGAEELKEDSGIETLVTVLSKRLNVTQSDWQIGHSKIFLRRELSDKLERLAKLRVHAAVRTISRFGKAVVGRQLARLLVAWVRFRLVLLKKYARRNAASRIASMYRRRKHYDAFKVTRKAVVRIQSIQRMLHGKHIARKMKDPFYDLKYKDLKSLLKRKRVRLEKAVNDQDFRGAADLEEQIETITQAMENKVPFTRKGLEDKIVATQEKLDKVLKEKSYSEAGPLQDELETLKSQRKDYPTIDELKKAVNDAEAAVATAAKNRDFLSAGQLQSDVESAKARLQAAMDAEKEIDGEHDDDTNDHEIQQTASFDGIDSRGDLESDIRSLRIEVDAAIAKKDFKAASELQAKIEEREKLRLFFPSIAELEEKLNKTKESLKSAIDSKNFGAAGNLHEEIDKLEALILAERTKSQEEEDIPNPTTTSLAVRNLDGKTTTFETRFDLEQEINLCKAKQTEAIGKKQFKRAEECQAVIDQLDSLRDRLPTASELVQTIRDTKSEMSGAITKKNFSEAERLDKEINLLQEQLTKEKQNGPENSTMKAGSTPIPFKRSPTTSSNITPTINSNTKNVRTFANGVVRPPSTLVTPLRARNTADDLSDSISVLTYGSAASKPTRTIPPRKNPILSPQREERPVSMLRPKRPVVSSTEDSILTVTKNLALKRGDAAIVVDRSGGLAGILTDTDVTRRVVAQQLDPSSTEAETAMTPNPMCVSSDDSAMDAFSLMIENKFRHLPVVDESGGVCGLLDIARCLNDAISKLEKSSQRAGSVSADELLKQTMSAAPGIAPNGTALQHLLGPLLQQALGNKEMPRLRSLLADRPTTIVAPETPILEAAVGMADSRKAALIVEQGELVGLFGFKDMMTRVVAKELDVTATEVHHVMTPSPESVSPDMTVLEALQTMHDNKFLTLPVCEQNGAVLGLVDVMDVIQGCSLGGQGWRSVFGSTLELDDLSESASYVSGKGSTNASRKLRKDQSKQNLVARLRPKKPLVSTVDDTVLSLAQMLTNNRGDASLVVGKDGTLSGIVTDTDITRRLVAQDAKARDTNVRAIMTPDPVCVSLSDSAMDAMCTMVERHFRHLPVLDDAGGVCGILDIAKCLNDAISRMESSQSKTASKAIDALQLTMKGHGAQGKQAAALQALLGPLMTQAFGNQSSPTLRSLLAGKPATVVAAETSIHNAGKLMAESRKAALVVEGNNLIGIFGFKDMMNRVVSKEIDALGTPISTVMTPNPESVTPDITIVEALEVMHDHGFLTLPVCETDGNVVGLVDVMDLILGCGGVDGWRSIFTQSLELDDLSDNFSNRSGSVQRSVKSKQSARKDDNLVSKLRPKKPLVSSTSDSVLGLAQMLASKRGDASLVVGEDGGLAGIITDTDVTRRVVAHELSAASTRLDTVMTRNPTCVALTDSAMDAMSTMVENHFRHLPVVDAQGGVCGLLDIAKCLNDAISKLEKSKRKKSADTGNALQMAMAAQGANGAQGAALRALLEPVMAQAFGKQTSPSLRSLLVGKMSTVVESGTNLLSVGKLMAERRKAALVVENDELVGIFGFKDMMTRVVAKELPLELTAVGQVMTPNPESVSPDTTVLEALQIMHDNKFLTLPVCETNGTVVGLVDVMDVIYGCGGVEGWRSVFNSSLQLEDLSDSASHYSGRGSVTASLTKSVRTKSRDTRLVKMLRPKRPVVCMTDDSIMDVAQFLSSNRSDAAIVVSHAGGVAGIITDTDMTRRVVAKHVESSSTPISEVMTADPKCVATTDTAMEAMMMMIENRFRHLPVVDDAGGVTGVLDIAKCLNDAISKLEKAKQQSNSTDPLLQKVLTGSQEGAALRALLGPLVDQAFGSKGSRTLGTILSGTPTTIVRPETSVLSAAMLMTDSRKAALVVDNGTLVGIFGFKDMMTRVLAKGLSPETTSIMNVMTPEPEHVSPNMTVLEALQTMHDNRFLTLPVCRDDGTVVGLVDVMDVIHACGGVTGWRAVFESALDVDDDASAARSVIRPIVSPRALAQQQVQGAPFASHGLPEHIPTTLEFEEGRVLHFDEDTLQDTYRMDESHRSEQRGVVFKVLDPAGNTHRLRSELRFNKLMRTLNDKVNMKQPLRLKFVDDEGDTVLISSDDDLIEAVKLSRSSSNNTSSAKVVVKLTAEIHEEKTGPSPTLIASIGATIAVLGLGAMIALRPRR